MKIEPFISRNEQILGNFSSLTLNRLRVVGFMFIFTPAAAVINRGKIIVLLFQVSPYLLLNPNGAVLLLGCLSAQVDFKLFSTLNILGVAIEHPEINIERMDDT